MLRNAGLVLGTFLVIAAAVACSGTVVVGDDGTGGSGGAPATTTSSTSKATGVTTTSGPSGPSGPAGPTGGCPPDPGFQGCGVGSSSASTGGEYGCEVIYCDPQGGPDLFNRRCTSEDKTCTCKGPSGTCVCDWNGDCNQPCCGN